MLSAVRWGPLLHGRVQSLRILFCLHLQVIAQKKASEPFDSEAPVEIGFKPRSFLPAAAFYLTSVRVKQHNALVEFSALLLRTRLFCRSQVPYQAPPLSDGGLFISTLGVKRQAPPLPCFVLDKKLTIPNHSGLCQCGCLRWLGLRANADWWVAAPTGSAVKWYTPGGSCGPNPRWPYCAQCKQGV